MMDRCYKQEAPQEPNAIIENIIPRFILSREKARNHAPKGLPVYREIVNGSKGSMGAS